MAKSNDKKSPVFLGFILSLLLHGTLIIIIVFRGFNSPASIKKADIISGRIVTLGNAGAPGLPKASRTVQKTTKQVQKKPVPKPQKTEKPKK